MSSPTSERRAARSPNLAIWLVVTIDALLILFPPFHWSFGNGDPAVALAYAIGCPTLVAASLPLLARLSRRQADPIEGDGR